MKSSYGIEKDIFGTKYFVVSLNYKYSFDWFTLQEIKDRFLSYPAKEDLENWYSDLDIFTKKKIHREKLKTSY